MNVLLIDSSFLCYKSYFAFRRLTADIEGITVFSGVIFGYLKQLISLHQENFNLIITLWDLPPYRKAKRFKSYKENRRKQTKIPDLKNEKEILQAILQDLNIPMILSPGFEAEDIAKSIKRKLKHDDIYLYSNDADCYALLGKHFQLINSKDGKLTHFTTKDLKKKMGLTPKEYIQAKAIMGCSTDNIQGIKGIGPAWAARLIKEFKTVDDLKKNLSNVKNERIRNLLQEGIKSGALRKSQILTKILSPKNLYQIKISPRIKFQDILEHLDARTLLEGQNYLILRKIKNANHVNCSIIPSLAHRTLQF